MLTGHSDCLTRRSCFITQYKTRLFWKFSIRYWEKQSIFNWEWVFLSFSMSKI